jgi:hypothetical protein
MVKEPVELFEVEVLAEVPTKPAVVIIALREQPVVYEVVCQSSIEVAI